MEVKNVFPILSENFFSALTGKYSQLISECISILYHKTKLSYFFTIERNHALDLLENNIGSGSYQIEDEDRKQLDKRDTVPYVIKN